MAADLAAGRHLNDQQRATVYDAGFRLQVQRRIDFLPVVDGSHEVFFHTVNRIRGNTQNLPVVFDAQENDSTVPVGKRTDGIWIYDEALYECGFAVCCAGHGGRET